MQSFKNKMAESKNLTKPESIKKGYSNDIEYNLIPKNIDDIEKQIESLKGTIYKSSYFIGKRLLEIQEKYLNDTEFKTIYEYAFEKYDFSKSTTYSMIFVAENFNEFQAHGLGSKLYLLQRVDKDKWDDYLKWMENDKPSYREIQARIKNEKDKLIDNENTSNEGVTLDLNKIIKSFQKESIPNLQKDLEFFISNWNNDFELEKTVEVNKKIASLNKNKKDLFWSKVNDLANKMLNNELV